MVLPSNTTISFSQIQTEMGGANPIAMSEYYANAAPQYCLGVAGIPNTGSSIAMSQFWGKAKSSSSYITSTSGLVGYYTGDSWTGTQLTDLSGAGNHGTPTGTIYSATYSTTSYKYIYGGTTAKIVFPAAILPATYTLFYVAKYNGANKYRIFTGPDYTISNWLSGFWGYISGVAYHGNWVTSSTTDVHGTNWFQATDQNNIFRSAKVSRTVAGGGTPSYCSGMTINGSIWGENSDWAVAMVAVYNRTLTVTEYTNIENELATKYLL